MSNSRPVIAFVISDVTLSMALEAFAQSYLTKDFDLHFFLLVGKATPFEKNLRKFPVTVHVLPNHGWQSQPLITMKLLWHFIILRPCAVHTTLLYANIFGQAAAFLARVRVRLLNRHHSDPYHFKHRHARFYDWLSQKLSTKIVVTSENVGEVLRDFEGVPAKKIVRIPFGVDEAAFNAVTEARRQKLRDEFQIDGRGPIVGMVSRLLEVKGFQYAIPAFREFLTDYPRACFLIARGAGGSYSGEVARLLKELPADSYRDIPLVLDMPAFYSLFDIFIHVPISRRGEASGQAYTESLAAGCPAIFTLSGLAPEFVQDGKNALVVPFKDASAIAKALRTLASDKDLRLRLGKNGRANVTELYPMDRYLRSHAELWTCSQS